MADFKRDKKPNGFGGGRSGGRSFGGGRSGGFGGGRSGGRSFGGGRDGGRPQMHQATCAECGDRCEVPFKPTGDKPVYCSNCFGHSPNYGSQRAKGGRDFDRRDSRGPQMFSAICAECGDDCEVPFKPTGDKPVLCSNCFGGGRNDHFDKKEFKPKTSNSDSSQTEALKEEVKQLHTKLDKILALLQRTTPVKEVTVMKAAKEVVEADNATSEKTSATKAKKITKKSEAAPKKKVTPKATTKKSATKTTVKKTTAKKKAPTKKK